MDEERASTARTLIRDEIMKAWRSGSCENFVAKWQELVYMILSQWREHRMRVI